MLSFEDIKDRLNKLDQWSCEETNDERVQLLCKLAVIEAGAWLEEYIEGKAKDFISGKSDEVQKEVDKIVEQNHGFDYKNIRKILIALVGNVGLCEVEKNNSTLKDKYSGTVSKLLDVRGKVAHKTLNISDDRIDGPTVYLKALDDLKLLVDTYYDAIQNI